MYCILLNCSNTLVWCTAISFGVCYIYNTTISMQVYIQHTDLALCYSKYSLISVLFLTLLETSKRTSLRRVITWGFLYSQWTETEVSSWSKPAEEGGTHFFLEELPPSLHSLQRDSTKTRLSGLKFIMGTQVFVLFHISNSRTS